MRHQLVHVSLYVSNYISVNVHCSYREHLAILLTRNNRLKKQTKEKSYITIPGSTETYEKMCHIENKHITYISLPDMAAFDLCSPSVSEGSWGVTRASLCPLYSSQSLAGWAWGVCFMLSGEGSFLFPMLNNCFSPWATGNTSGFWWAVWGWQSGERVCS